MRTYVSTSATGMQIGANISRRNSTAERYAIEPTNAWMDSYRSLLNRFTTIERPRIHVELAENHKTIKKSREHRCPRIRSLRFLVRIDLLPNKYLHKVQMNLISRSYSCFNSWWSFINWHNCVHIMSFYRFKNFRFIRIS